jgi:trk system potassium uptake protein TrkH
MVEHLINRFESGQSTLKNRVLKASPPAILTSGYLVLIIFGTSILKLPLSTTRSVTWLETLFTSASAVTLTGLGVADIGTRYTVFGQTVIALLIQAGGLGFMTFSVLTVLSIGKRIGVRHQMLALEAFNETSLNKIREVARAVVYFALAVESIGFVLLALTWSGELGWRLALYHAFFYTVSAFNNAGLVLSADNLMPYASDVPVNLIISSLFIIGGLGFVVLQDLWQTRRRWKRLQPYTKLILGATVIINLGAWLLVWLFERNNAATIANLPLAGQLTASWFQAVTPRTAGFNTLPIESLTDPTALLMIVLMFIGGGSMSTAGGIKLGTFVVIFMTTYAFLGRSDDVTMMRRSVQRNVVMKAFSVSVISMTLVIVGTLALSALEGAPLLDSLFEVVSALSTAGLSRGLTGELSTAGRCLIMILMFVGRLGPLTAAYVIATPKKRRVRYPSVDIQVG